MTCVDAAVSRTPSLRVRAVFKSVKKMRSDDEVTSEAYPEMALSSSVSSDISSVSSTDSSSDGASVKRMKRRLLRLSLLLQELVLEEENASVAANEHFVEEESVNLCLLRADPEWRL